MEEAMKQVTDAGFPPLGVFKMMTPACVSIFVKKEIAMRNALDFVTPMELQVIYTVVSAANNCEMCPNYCCPKQSLLEVPQARSVFFASLLVFGRTRK